MPIESRAHPGMNPSLGLGKEGPTFHRIKGYPQPLEHKVEILVAWEKEDNGRGMGDGGEEPCYKVLIEAVLIARNSDRTQVNSN